MTDRLLGHERADTAHAGRAADIESDVVRTVLILRRTGPCVRSAE